MSRTRTDQNSPPSSARRPKARTPVLLCQVCQRTFTTPDELHWHRRDDHFECHVCGADDDGTPKGSFHRNVRVLRTHIRTAHPHRWCEMCRAPIPEASKSLHLSRQHFQCPHCPRSGFYRTVQVVHTHIRTAHPDRWCDLCRVFIAEASKSLHMLRRHHCPYCLLDTIHDLHAHTRTHHPPLVSSERPTPRTVGKYYSLLDVSPAASRAEVLRAARVARIRAHPDRHRSLAGADGSAAARTRAVNEHAMEVGQAADVLCDERARRKYDLDVERGRRE